MRAMMVFEADEEFTGTLYEVLRVEEERAVSDAKLYQSGKRLELRIEAEDVSELRAAINSWLRLVKMCWEMWRLVDVGSE